MLIGRKIYYNLLNGNVILDTKEHSGNVLKTSIDEDLQTYIVLQDYVKSNLGVLELEYGQYFQDFTESNSYRVNLETKELEFSYPDPNELESPIEYQKPLSEEFKELDTRTSATEDALLAIMMGGMM